MKNEELIRKLQKERNEHEHSFIPVTYIGMIDPITGKCYFDKEKCTKCGSIRYLIVPKEINRIDFVRYLNDRNKVYSMKESKGTD